ncbi:L,D-transpeptidase [Methyloligella solikamskensis]|uniref:L,D-transpeptidase n=1 Tax=Methyloligella solikamskensis TaxID=1177756 RepID=A0ABW3JE46_9HYPH
MAYSNFRAALNKLFNPVSLLVLGVALALMLAVSGPAHANVRINIDKTTQKMDVYVDGQPRYRWDVSTGLQGYDTPSGSFTPFRMEEDHFSRQYDDAPMPYSIFFTKQGHAIHGTMDARYMGQAASHGCVRLLPKHAAVLYQLVKDEGMANTTVSITGDIGPGQTFTDQRQDRRRFYDDAYQDRRYAGPGYYQEYESRGLFGNRRERRGGFFRR